MMRLIMKRETKKEPVEVKSKDAVIRRNLDRIWVSAATPQPSNPSRHGQMSLPEIFCKNSLLLREIDYEREEWRLKEMK